MKAIHLKDAVVEAVRAYTDLETRCMCEDWPQMDAIVDALTAHDAAPDVGVEEVAKVMNKSVWGEQSDVEWARKGSPHHWSGLARAAIRAMEGEVV